MKIGILTHPVRCNYGGALQAYALQSYLQGKGYDVVIIDLHRPARLMSRLHHWVERNIFHRRFTQFAHRNMCRTPRVTTDAALRAVAAGCDAVIVGSDQVWRLTMVHGLERHYFLDFVPENSRRIAYAASFGLSDLEPCDEALYRDIKTLVAQFSAVSVREASGVDICRKHWNVDARQVLDPTLLAGREAFESLADRNSKRLGELFYYFLGNRGAEVAHLYRLAHGVGKRAFTVNAGRTLRVSKFAFAFYPAVERWIDAFRRAEVVVTDSFHGVCFSLLFNKPFYVVGNKSGGVSRIESILNLFGLQERFVTSLNDIKSYDQLAAQNIDYTHINNRLAELRVDSEDFILKALKQ